MLGLSFFFLERIIERGVGIHNMVNTNNKTRLLLFVY